MKLSHFSRSRLSLESLETRLVPTWLLNTQFLAGGLRPALIGPAVQIGQQTGGPGTLQVHWMDSPSGTTMRDFVVTQQLTKASPNLIQACATGRHLPRVQLTTTVKQDAATEYATITLEDVIVSSYQPTTGGASQDRPMESLSLNFARVRIALDNFQPPEPNRAGRPQLPALPQGEDLPLEVFFDNGAPAGGIFAQNKGPIQRVIRVEKTPNGETTTTFDGAGNVVHVTKKWKREDGSTVIMDTDGKGNTRYTVIHPENNGTTTTTYEDGKGNPLGKKVEKKEADGSTTIREYDAKGAQIRKTEIRKNADGSTTTTVTDTSGKGRVVRTTVTGKDKKGNDYVITYVDGKLVHVSRTVKAPNGDTVTTEQNGAGKVVKKTVTHKNPDGSTTTTETDAKGNKTRITREQTDKDGTKTTLVADGKGNVQKVIEVKTNPDGSKTTTEYQGKGKLP